MSIDSKVQISEKPNLEINRLRELFEDNSATDIIHKTHSKFGERTYALTSFGTESGIMIKLLQQSGVKVDFIHINSGFLFDETTEYRKFLTKKYDLNVHVFSPEITTISDLQQNRIWETDIEAYSYFTKLEPMQRAIGVLGVRALLVGIRSWQTDIRSSKKVVEQGEHGEFRIHPVLNWSREESMDYLSDFPKHPLEAYGYSSVGDWTTTIPGQDRSGRLLPQLECGINR